MQLMKGHENRGLIAGANGGRRGWNGSEEQMVLH